MTQVLGHMVAEVAVIDATATLVMRRLAAISLEDAAANPRKKKGTGKGRSQTPGPGILGLPRRPSPLASPRRLSTIWIRIWAGCLSPATKPTHGCSRAAELKMTTRPHSSHFSAKMLA